MEPTPLRQIRAHVHDKQGVAHAAPSERGPRYCQLCHGASLQGGNLGEPSCFTCHGSRWEETDSQTSLAPGDHTQVQNGFHHHPDLQTPFSTCTSCHGANLEGSLDEGTPSCYLCHDQKWSG